MDFTGITQIVVATVTSVGLRVVGALIIWIVGRMLINMAVRLVSRALTIRHIDATITRYLANSILTVILNIVLVVAILGFFGVETTTFAALVAAPASRSASHGEDFSAVSPPGRS